MPVESRSLEVQPTRDRVRCLFIVAGNQPDLWHYLRRDFARDDEVQVVLAGERSAASGEKVGRLTQ